MSQETASLTVGSDGSCDIRLGGPGVRARHLTITRDDGGSLVMRAEPGAPLRVGDAVVPPGESRVFDFRTAVTLGQATALPLTHPKLAELSIEVCSGPEPGQDVLIGRDPSRCHVVVHHPNVSGLHARARAQPLTICDLGSTSGTFLHDQRLAAQATTPLAPGDLIRLGPIPLSGAALSALCQRAQGAPKAALTSSAAAGAPATAAASALSPAVTVAKRGAPAGRPRHATIVGTFSLSEGGAPTLQTIGRNDADITISHPQVSSRHAILHQQGGSLFVEDCGSANGTFVRGKRIAAGKRVAVQPGEKIFIGPMPLRIGSEREAGAVVVDDAPQWEGRPLYEIEAWDLTLEVADRDNPKQSKVLLDHVSFKAMPGDFIALMGPSGAGKTTLLLTLNGYLPPSAGQVRINGENLYSIFDALRGSIGYVPQDDIVHPELTVREAVRYSARFRLPPDFTDQEIDERVQTTLDELGLESVAHLQIGKPEKKVLSGGQRKRVNIAMELVTDPVIMFLDEPTSGLAADDTTALVDLLARLAKTTGKTIITTIHQPAKAEFEKFNLALIMGPGGLLTFYGPTCPDAYRFFQAGAPGPNDPIDNPRDLFEAIARREHAELEALTRADPGATRAAARQRAAKAWQQLYFRGDDPTYRKMFEGARAIGKGSQHSGVFAGRRATRGQLRLLLDRYFRVKKRDVGGSAIMLLQAPVIGVLLALVFGGQEPAAPYWCLGALQQLAARSGEKLEATSQLLESMPATSDNTAAIFFLSVAAVWFGTSNAAREIVSERAIYLRERMVNLGLFNYVLSKFFLLSLVTVIQCGALLGIVHFALGLHGGAPAFLWSLATLIATAMNSIATGLLLSALVASSEAAMALTPIALIPQVVLGGLMVPMTTNEALRFPMYFMPARWGFQGMVGQERMAIATDPAWILDLQRPKLDSIENFISAGKFHCAEAQIASDTLSGAWGFVHFQSPSLPLAVLSAIMVATLGAIAWVLRRRDRI